MPLVDGAVGEENISGGDVPSPVELVCGDDGSEDLIARKIEDLLADVQVILQRDKV